MADSVPPLIPEPRHPMSMVDGCPNCVSNVEPPFSYHELETGWSCSYICRDCSHIWTTDWSR